MTIGRKIEKKIISDDLLFSDDFDESKLSKIEDQLDRSPAPPDAPKGKKRSPAEPGDAEQATPPDPVSAPPPTMASPGPEGQALSGPPAGNGPEQAVEPPRQALARVARFKMMVLLAATSALVLITAGLTYFIFFHHKPPAPPAPQVVRHRIVIPSYETDASFLVFVAAADKKRDLMKLDLGLEFRSQEAQEQFKQRQLFYCDIIYQFLSKQLPLENSFQYWEKISERELLERLKQDYPETRLNAVHMKSFHRL